MSKEEKKYDIEDRLIDFAVRIIRLAGSLPKTKVGSHIANQIIRSLKLQRAKIKRLHNSKFLVRYSIFDFLLTNLIK